MELSELQYDTYISKPISLSFKEVQITFSIAGALFSPNVNSIAYEQTFHPVTSYNISESSKNNTDIISTITSSASTTKTYELDSYGIKIVETANTDFRLSYFNAERFIESESYIFEKQEEELSMYDKLVSHREKVEHTGLYGGVILGLATMSVPLFIDIQWQATFPAALLLFSLPLSILYRRKVRGGN